MDVTDEALARRAADGDREAFATLLARNYDRLFAFAFRLSGARAEAEDLTQDICAALPAKLASFRGEARFSTWTGAGGPPAGRGRQRAGAIGKRTAAPQMTRRRATSTGWRRPCAPCRMICAIRWRWCWAKS